MYGIKEIQKIFLNHRKYIKLVVWKIFLAFFNFISNYKLRLFLKMGHGTQKEIKVYFTCKLDEHLNINGSKIRTLLSRSGEIFSRIEAYRIEPTPWFKKIRS
jgi:hypothetical protein